MTKKTDDLWPATIGEIKLRAPANILKEQAALLGQKTQNIVVAEVIPIDTDPDALSFAFNLVAPALNNYRLRVLRIRHEVVRFYPTEIRSTLLREGDKKPYRIWVAESEEVFLSVLRTIFGDERTVMAIQSLRAQSEGFPVKDEEIPF